jgi:hypothetical protein
MTNYSTDFRVNNPRLISPLEPNNENPRNPIIPHSEGYNDSNINIINQSFAYPSGRFGYPIIPRNLLGRPGYPERRPAYPEERKEFQVRPNRRSIIWNQIKNCMSRCGSSIPFPIFLYMELSVLIQSLNYPWFDYCYFSFGLLKEKKISDSEGKGSNSLEDFYDDFCKPDKDYFEDCPHFCRSIKEISKSGKVMFGFSIVVIVLASLTMLLYFVKLCRRRTRIPIKGFTILSCLSIVIYLVGFVYYYQTSKFSSFSKIKGNVDTFDFDWSVGLIFAINILSIQLFLALISQVINRSLYR